MAEISKRQQTIAGWVIVAVIVGYAVADVFLGLDITDYLVRR